MIDRIIQWSLENRFAVLAVALVVLAWGAWESVKMPVDVFPDLSAPTVTIVAEAHGMAPQEVESQITFPIETAMNGASGVRRVRSSTGVGIAVIWVEFEWGADIYRARQTVAEKLQLVNVSLPPGVPPPSLAPISSIMGEIMFVALRSDVHTPMELKTMADWTIRPRLLSVVGISQVIPTGGDTRQYQVMLDPARLLAYEVTVGEVLEAVKSGSENASAGFYKEGGQQYLIHGIGRIKNLDELADVLVTMRGDQPVLVRHIGDVRIGPALKMGAGSYNAQPAVIIGIQKQPDANTIALTERLDKVLDDIQRSLPAGMTIERNVFRQADFIKVAVDNVAEALRDGALLVVAIVFLFLLSWRATGVTILAIPLSLLVAVLSLKAMGATINTMTLGGFAIAVGALVDDAIIDVENIVRRLRENRAKPELARRPILQVVYEASKEIRGSIVFATLIIILVFVPVFFLEGVEGRLLRPLGLAYVISLAASLLVALTVTPALSMIGLTDRKTTSKGEAKTVTWLKRLYEPVLGWSLRKWKSLLAVSVVLLVASLIALSFVGTSFLPDFNEGTLTIGAVTLPGTSLEESDRIGRWAEEILLDHPEVVAIARRTGRAELDEHAQDVNASEMEVTLVMGERSKSALLASLRQSLSQVPGTNITIGQPISHRIDHMLSGTRSAIAVKIFGEQLPELQRLSEEVRVQMAEVSGVVDLSVEQQSAIPFLRVEFDRGALARYGLRMKDVMETLEVAFAGHETSRVIEGQKAFDITVRYNERSAQDLDTVRSTLVPTRSGAYVPLHAVADIRKDIGPNTISRENVQRKIVVMSNVAGRDLGSVVDDIRTRVRDNVSFPEGYHVEYGGQFESAEEASATLFVLSIVVILGIFALLYAAFRSFRDSALVMLNLPLALIGGVIGVYFSGGVLSIAAIIGFITLFGIATRNGLMLVSHISHLRREEGVTDPVQLVTQGALERLSPILMTALATAFALIPLVLAAGEPGSEIQAPMAMVILCGLTTSTVLNMLVMPAMYLRFGSATQEGE
jgi:CzcA family heavy metal efflux pump